MKVSLNHEYKIKNKENGYSYDITSIKKWVNDSYIEYCYSTGIPDSEEYGKIECFEIYYYKTENLSNGHYRSYAYGNKNNKKINEVPSKHDITLNLLKRKHKEIFGVEYVA